MQNSSPAHQAVNAPPPGAGVSPGRGSQDQEELPFQQLGHYRIERRLGQGGMGDVYLGFEEALQRRVALKVLPAILARDPDFVRRFQTEATAAARLAHPNLVPVYFIGTDAGHHFFAMQYVEGESLAQRLAQRGRLPVEEAVTIVEHCLAGLAAAHRAGLVHRDIKPGNILLDRKSGRALVADFGLVKSATAGRGMTVTGMILGTTKYLAPEQAQGGSVDGRSDLYSLGIVAYQMLSGRLPFQAETPQALLFQQAYEQPPALSQVAPDVPAAIGAVVEKLLARDPASRYQAAAEVLADLRRWRAGALQADETPTLLDANASLVGKLSLPGATQLPEVPPGWLQGVQEEVAHLLRAQAPGVLERVQNTEQQVDGAVAEYRRRRDELAKVVAEATAAVQELAAQAVNQRRAAAAAAAQAETASSPEAKQAAREQQQACEDSAIALEAQVANQREELAQASIHLSELETTLRGLASQRDLLRVRLHAAQGRLYLGGKGILRRRRRWLALALLGVGLIVGTWWWFAHQKSRTVSQSLMPSSAPQASNPPLVAAKPNNSSPPNPIVSPVAPARVIIPPFRTLKGHTNTVLSVACSANGQRVLSGGEDKTVRVWDVEHGNQTFVKEEQTSRSEVTALSLDGGRALSLRGPADLLWWDAANGKELGILHGTEEFVIREVVFSADGRRAITAHDRSVRLWDLEVGQQLTDFSFGRLPIYGLAFSQDESQILCGGSDKTVWLVDATGGQLIRQFEGNTMPVKAVGFSPDGRRVLSASDDGMLRIWEKETGVEVKQFKVNPSTLLSAAFSRDGRRALIACQEGMVRLVDLEQGRDIALLTGFSEPARCVAFSADGTRAVAGGVDKTVRVWNLPK